MYRYTVTAKAKDQANGNIVVTVNFVDDANPTAVHTRQTWAYDLTDDAIDAWAKNVITTLNVRDVNFSAITVGVPKIPK